MKHPRLNPRQREVLNLLAASPAVYHPDYPPHQKLIDLGFAEIVGPQLIITKAGEAFAEGGSE